LRPTRRISELTRLSVASEIKRPSRKRPAKDTAAPALEVAETVPANKKFIYKGEVLERTGVSAQCVWRWMKEGTFPAAVAVGGRTAWLESDIDAWMSSRPLRQYGSS
jgi:prophage regulatory protein